MTRPLITYYVATSLDMFIAREDGSVDWLQQEGDFGYLDFLSHQQGLLMGSTTYRQILGFGDWPYGDLPTFVFTSRKDLPRAGNTNFVDLEVAELMPRLVELGLERVWLVGGGDLAGQYLAAGLLDELHLFLHPMLLGQGIPLFGREQLRRELELVGARDHETGLVQLDYRFTR